MRIIEFYKIPGNISPVKEFLDSLNEKEAEKVAWVLRIVRDLPRVPIQYYKKLESTEGIWETRIQLASNAFRMLGFIDGNKIVLTNGFRKKSQKTPAREIEIAEARKIEYFKRKGINYG